VAPKKRAKKPRARRRKSAGNVPAEPMSGRSMFVWQLKPILAVEGGASGMASKAVNAGLSAVWIKIAVGRSEYSQNTVDLPAVLDEFKAAGIRVWGWHEPRCATAGIAEEEAALVGRLAGDFSLDGILMDAERASGQGFFHGGPEEAELYAGTLQRLLHEQEKPLAICSHDIPGNFPEFPFESFAKYSDFNVPQVYYGGSPGVGNRLTRAIEANADIHLPFVPVGAGWVGDGGGCTSASACAERALTFIQLTRGHGFIGHAFWHWAGAPLALWQTLMENRVA
jgi:hypothetical protein